MKIQKAIAVCTAVIGLTAGLTTHAQSKSGNNSKAPNLIENLKEKCQSDLTKLCKEVTPGEGRIAACLDSKEDQLSEGCKKAWTGTKTQVSNRMDQAELAFRKNCAKDVQKFCSNVPSGRGRLLDCLDDHKGNLSPSCQKFHTALDQRLSELIG